MFIREFTLCIETLLFLDQGVDVTQHRLIFVVASHRSLLLRAAANLDEDRKSTRLNSSHGYISYAVFCLKKKKTAHISHRCIASRSSPYSHISQHHSVCDRHRL